MQLRQRWNDHGPTAVIEQYRPLLGSAAASYDGAVRDAPVTWASAVKRGLDILGAATVLLAVLPLLIVTAIIIMAVSPGNPFYSQMREGLGGKPIRIWKVRSMVPNADALLRDHLESNPAARWEYERTLKLRDDPRIIPGIGHFVRQTSIDELPQLWNVLTGDMSLVGPRVMPDVEVTQYSRRGQHIRRSVRPGITGLWQVMFRNDSELRVRELADCYYVRNWSMRLDLWIALKTVVVVFARKGAY